MMRSFKKINQKKKNRKGFHHAIAGLIPILIIIVTLSSACQSKQAKTGNQKQASISYYTCPMHSQVHEEKPGSCPICGMTLIKITTDSSSDISLDAALNYLTQPVTKTAVGNFKVISPVKINAADTIIADGYTSFDKRAVNNISARVSGRIEKLYVKYTNQTIRKGQALMKLYSPQLLTAQQNLLQAIKDNDVDIINPLKENLYNLGMSPQEIKWVIENKQALVNITIYSPYSGISQTVNTSMGNADEENNIDINVPENNLPENKNATAPELLNVQEGQYVDAGQIIFSVQNINRIWAILNVFSNNMANIHKGDPVQLYAANDPENIISGKIDFIPAYHIDEEKTSRVRVYLNNIPGNWKIGTLLKGNIIINKNESGWFVPVSAVNRLGKNNIVWIQDKKNENVFHARKIDVGEEMNNNIRIISGLQDSDKIAANAAYMVGSDSFIQ